MAFDFKKAYKEFYLPKNKPEIVHVPTANYIAVKGAGDPNEEGGAYQQAIRILYAVAYTLKMSHRTDHKIQGFFEYVVPPLEGLWWQDDMDRVDHSDKSTFNWISLIRLPDFITEADFKWAVETAAKKKQLDCSPAQFLTMEEGLCVQIMHTARLMRSLQQLPWWMHIWNRMDMQMTSTKADCITRSICPMQERFLQTNGRPLSGIQSKRYSKSQ